MKDMIRIKNDQIKQYKESFQKSKSKSPSKYTSQELSLSASHSNLYSINNSQNHKRSTSQNQTNSKPHAQEGKNLLQQYNNYIQLKQGTSRTQGHMSLNMAHSVQHHLGHSTENMKDEEMHHSNQAQIFQPNYVNLYLGGSSSQGIHTN